MTVRVTGGAGYIGSHMVHALVDAGERVVLLDNLATGFNWAVAQGASLVIGEWEINRAWVWPRHPQSGPAFFALNADLWQSATRHSISAILKSLLEERGSRSVTRMSGPNWRRDARSYYATNLNPTTAK